VAFHDSALLALLERDSAAVIRAAHMLGSTCGRDPDDWPLTEIDRALLELHLERHGDRLGAFVICPECEERLELALSISALLASFRSSARPPQRLSTGAWELELRRPTLADLRRAAAAPEQARGAEELGRACVVSARRGGRTVRVDRLPRRVITAVEDRLTELDPAGEPVELTCPSCTLQWSESLEITELVVNELESDARSLLAEVHALASAYGWSESEIVALPASRRREYVSMVVA
jgi:hypothetical protein